MEENGDGKRHRSPACDGHVGRARRCAVLGESNSALELIEGDRAPVIYFPRMEVAMEFHDQSCKVATCAWKGDATHYSIITTFTTLRDVAWSYRAPHDSASAIKDHIAFNPHDEIAIERH